MNRQLRLMLSAIFFASFLTTFSHADSESWKFKNNNNNVIKLQQQGGDFQKTGDVQIEFYGHMAFKITSPAGIRILIDPWRNDPSGAWGLWFPKPFPEIEVDIVLSTHAHFDHDAVYLPKATMVLERLAGNFTLGDVKITGIAEKHVCAVKGWYKWTDAAAEFNQDFCPPNNFLHMDNFIQIIETGGIRIAHWGDNRPQPAEFAEALLRNIDVLIMNIDGSKHILSYEDIDAALTRYKPNIIIPAHYYTKGVNSVLSTLQSAEDWVNRQPNIVKLSKAEITLSKDKVNQSNRKILYFGMHHAAHKQ